MAMCNDQVSKKIMEFAQELISKRDVLEWEDTPHITVLYGLHKTVKAKALTEIIDKHIKHPIEATIKKVGIFEGDEQDVVKFDIESPVLHKLNKAIRNSVEYTNSYDDFQPHITLAYTKKGTAKKYAGNKTFFNYPLLFTDLHYNNSDGKLIKDWFLLKTFADFTKR